MRDRAETATNREAQCDKSGNLEAETNWAPSGPWLHNVNQIDQSLTQHRPPYVDAFVGDIELDPITVELDLVDPALAGKNLVDPRGFNEAGKGASVPIVPGFLRWKSTLFTLAGFALRLPFSLPDQPSASAHFCRPSGWPSTQSKRREVYNKSNERAGVDWQGTRKGRA